MKRRRTPQFIARLLNKVQGAYAALLAKYGSVNANVIAAIDHNSAEYAAASILYANSKFFVTNNPGYALSAGGEIVTDYGYGLGDGGFTGVNAGLLDS